MRMRYKIFIIIGIAWTAFLTFAFTEEIQQSWLNFLAVAPLFSLLLYLVIHVLIVHRIEMLNEQLSQINFYHKRTAHLDVKGRDEAAALAMQINALLVVEHSLQQQVTLQERAKHKPGLTINTNLKLAEHKKKD